jgi:16S rRNA (cytosine967-C5)-methyltransferase
MNARIAAIHSIVAVLERGEMLDEALPGAAAGLPARDRALAQELSYGVLRWYYRFLPLVDRLLHRPMNPGDLDLKVLLLVALHEMEHLRTPDHAAVSEAVAGTRLLGKPWASGLVNALLRRFQRERTQLLADVLQDPAIRLAQPRWLMEEVQRDWPEHWEQILMQSNERPPMDIRVNLGRCTRAQYIQELAAAGIDCRASPLTESGVRLSTPVNVQELPGFESGLVTVQDSAAQLAASLLNPQAGQRVLDACAAPGGKATHILEYCPGVSELVAVDQGADRVALLAASLRRLQLSARVVDADARTPAQWWDGRAFDRILLDAPCSATGVIRRHPDIKVLRQAGQLPKLEQLQAALLEALWPLLAAGGRLLYVTCSLLHRENDRQIEKFSGKHKDVRVLPIAAAWGTATNCGRQTLPSLDDTDGFYYALLERL